MKQGKLWVIGISLVGLIGGSASADSILDDQFQVFEPGLAVTIAETILGPIQDIGRDDGTFYYDGARSVHPLGSGSDAAGNFYQISSVPNVFSDVVRLTPTGERQTLLHVDEQVGFTCETGATSLQVTQILNLSVDSVNGALLLLVSSSIHKDLGFCADHGKKEVGIVRLSGLPVLLDVVLSYEPATSMLSWNVPVKPEGLDGADTFNLYAGDIRAASNLLSATPMRCNVPSGRTPVPGEKLTEPDPLQDPNPGEGIYYLVEVAHQGQARAGRQSVGGVLQGRNAMTLQGCPQ